MLLKNTEKIRIYILKLHLEQLCIFHSVLINLYLKPFWIQFLNATDPYSTYTGYVSTEKKNKLV